MVLLYKLLFLRHMYLIFFIFGSHFQSELVFLLLLFFCFFFLLGGGGVISKYFNF